MIETDSLAGWLFFAVVASLIAFMCAWAASDKPFIAFVRDAVRATADYLRKLWRFWGPRATDKNALGVMFANVALLNIVDVQTLNVVELGLWIGANVLFTPYENLPFETLEGPRPAPTVEIHGAVQLKATP